MSTTRIIKWGMAALLVMMSVIFIAVAGLALSLFIPGSDSNETPVVEAGGMWYAWLYHPQMNSFVRVYEDGATEDYSLALEPGENLASSPTAFGPVGQRIALCTYNESTSSLNLLVDNFEPNAAMKAGTTFPVRYPLTDHMECSVARNAFNASDPNLLALGVINYFPGAENADPDQPQWELLVFDVAQGAVIASYDAHSPGADSLQPFGDDRRMFMPLVHHYDGDAVTFELAPWGTEYIPGENVVEWTVGTDTLAQVAAPVGQLGLQVHPVTRERVWPSIDESLPAAQPRGPMPTYNVVRYQRQSDAEPIVIFHDPTVLASRVEFVKGGEQVAIYVTPGFDPDEDPNLMQHSEWLLLNRDGTITPTGLSPFTYDVAGLVSGLAAWTSDYDAQSATLTLYRWESDFANAESSVIWSNTDPNWRMLWAASQPAANFDSPFPAVQP